jgi:hypothetical protein
MRRARRGVFLKCAIMQPTYFPWSGYFHLIDQADIFIFLDDIQFEKRSWQSRNRILLNGQAHWLSVPVKNVAQNQKICEIQIDDTQAWRTKQQRTLQQTYAKHPFFHELTPFIEVIGDRSIQRLAELNVKIIKIICSALEIQKKFYLSSELNLEGKRSEKLIAICEHLNCDEYVSPQGSADYLAEDRFTEQTSVRLSFQNYTPRPYEQIGSDEFVSHLSILDVIANIGCDNASNYVRRSQ